jgi:hypothetical protein
MPTQRKNYPFSYLKQISEQEDCPEKRQALNALANSSIIVDALRELGIEYRERVFSPLWTLWAWLSQLLSSDQSCRKAVAAINVIRQHLGEPPCSMSTGAYTRARQRLTEEFLTKILQGVSRQLEEAQLDHWLWHKRHVKLVDGTTASMPDTPSNQAAYSYGKAAYPCARIVGIFSLASGANLDSKVSKLAGKANGEPSLLMRIWGCIKPGDILLFDRNFSNYPVFARCLAGSADFVSRLNAALKLENYRRRRIGKNEWHVTLKKGAIREKCADKEALQQAPEEIIVRVIKAQIKTQGYRCKTIYVVTSLLDNREFPKEEIVELYSQRWAVELDLRDVKTTLKMNVLRAKTAEMVRKEIIMHMICYNLLRIIMAQAAARHSRKPREISFKMTLQTFEIFRMTLTVNEPEAYWQSVYDSILDLIGTQPVIQRPGRLEPRAVRRVKQKYRKLVGTREEARKKFWKTNGSSKRASNPLP